MHQSQQPLNSIRVPAVTQHYSSGLSTETSEAYVTLNIVCSL